MKDSKMKQSEENNETEIQERLKRYVETLKIIEDMQQKLDEIEAGKKIFTIL